jgi:hypothetical protein
VEYYMTDASPIKKVKGLVRKLIDTISVDTPIYRISGKLQTPRYSSNLNSDLNEAKILLVDINGCEHDFYPIIFYLSKDTKQIDILHHIANAITVAEKKFTCTKGMTYHITEYDNTDRYIYVLCNTTKISV